MYAQGPSIKYVTLFLANFDLPSLCHTLSHIPEPPESTSHISDPPFLVGLVQNPEQKPLVQILSQLFAGGFVREVCQGVFGLEGFDRGGFCPFPLLLEYICYNRKLKITLNFMFQMYDKKIYKCDVTCSLPPTPNPCHKLSHLLGPSTPSSVTYFMDGP